MASCSQFREQVQERSSEPDLEGSPAQVATQSKNGAFRFFLSAPIVAGVGFDLKYVGMTWPELP